MSRSAVLAMLIVAVLIGLTGCRQADGRTATFATTPPPTPIVLTPVPATVPDYGTPTPIPTIARPPLPTATAIIAPPPCHATDLAIVDGGENGASGVRFKFLYFWNRGESQCSLVGIPGVELLDEEGTVVLANPPQASGAGFPFFAGETTGAIVLSPNLPMPTAHRNNGRGYALVRLESASRGPGAGAEPCRPPMLTPVRMRFTLPITGGTVLIDWSISTCDGRFRVSPFYEIAAPGTPTP